MNIAAYAEGVLSPSTIDNYSQQIRTVGWTSIMVSLFQVDKQGNINFNGDSNIVCSNGSYVWEPAWPGQLAELKSGGTVNTLLATFGGWDSCFYNVTSIYANNGRSFAGTSLAANCRAFRTAFPAFDLIDMDVEFPDGTPQLAQEAFLAFCELWIQAGFGLTFCPFTDPTFWTTTLVQLEAAYPGSVQWWNLQCYAGGGGNDPAAWAGYIKNALPEFNTDGYILASDWTRFWNGSAQPPAWQGDCPGPLEAHLAQFRGEPCVGGGFIWTIDQILSYQETLKTHPDPDQCKQTTLQCYVNAIEAGLTLIE